MNKFCGLGGLLQSTAKLPMRSYFSKISLTDAAWAAGRAESRMAATKRRSGEMDIGSPFPAGQVSAQT
jgi:hypothetical protein